MKKNKKKLTINKFKVARIGKKIVNIYGGTSAPGDDDTDGTNTISIVDRPSQDGNDCNSN